MFIRPSDRLIIPQTEHLKLAGVIAEHWGNNTFQKPSIDHDAFVKGVTEHDAAYGQLDTLSITDMSQEARREILTKLIDQDLGNPTSNIVALCHVLRLIGEDPSRNDLREQCLTRIDIEIEKTEYLHHDFAWADPITELCDNISFDFCLEEHTPAHGEVYRLKTDTQATLITYTIVKNTIMLDPWPLDTPRIEGSILGYEEEGYPKSKTHHIPYIITSSA